MNALCCLFVFAVFGGIVNGVLQCDTVMDNTNQLQVPLDGHSNPISPTSGFIDVWSPGALLTKTNPQASDVTVTSLYIGVYCEIAVPGITTAIYHRDNLGVYGSVSLSVGYQWLQFNFNYGLVDFNGNNDAGGGSHFHFQLDNYDWTNGKCYVATTSTPSSMVSYPGWSMQAIQLFQSPETKNTSLTSLIYARQCRDVVSTGITTGETTGITTGPVSTGITTGETTGSTTGVTTGITTGITTGVTTGSTTGLTTTRILTPCDNIVSINRNFGVASVCYFPPDVGQECINLGQLFIGFRNKHFVSTTCKVTECKDLSRTNCVTINGGCSIDTPKRNLCFDKNVCQRGWNNCVRFIDVPAGVYDDCVSNANATLMIPGNAGVISGNIGGCSRSGI